MAKEPDNKPAPPAPQPKPTHDSDFSESVRGGFHKQGSKVTESEKSFPNPPEESGVKKGGA